MGGEWGIVGGMGGMWLHRVLGPPNKGSVPPPIGDCGPVRRVVWPHRVGLSVMGSVIGFWGSVMGFGSQLRGDEISYGV